MKRREFLRTSLRTAAWMAAGAVAGRAAVPKKAQDVVQLGPDKVRLSRLAIGTGTKGGSIQRQLGLEGLADLLHFGYDQGLFFWDTADGYRTHPHVREALKRVPREKVAILTKTRARTADQMRADLDRFRKELDTDYLDIVLLHAVTSPNWPEERQGAMDVLAEAREKGIVRTHGVSCHSLAALETAARTPWVRVDLARINFAGMLMDAEPETVVPILRRMKAEGKGIIGMKILGEGGLSHRVEEALRYALSLDCIDCFTIGPANREELADLIRRIPAAAAAKAA
ncbi:MAG: aldo/keto reductase [Bryobacterales bacterium]|nr:aldo/keto reductase [Bryobacteraceae bacterium]MDW8129851.1 aldo/keto reductase [Bryobacterales bacterium]